MSDLVIHNINISYDESHDRVREFVKYLMHPEHKDEVKAYYEEAKRDQNHKVHLADKSGNEFTLEYKGEHVCELRLRGM